MKKVLPLIVLAMAASFSQAIVIRHDRPVADYNAIGSNPLFNATGFFGTAGSSFAFGSGVMVSPTKIVTAAHLFDANSNGVLDAPASTFGFNVGNNTFTLSQNVASIFINPGWVSSSGRAANDWAVVNLNAPINGLNYANLRFENPLGLMGAMVGYGAQGLGTTGHTSSGIAGANDRLGAFNMIDQQGSSGFLTNALLTDFDSPTSNTSTMGSSTPLNLEGTTAPGDSGSGLWGQWNDGWYLVGTLNGGSTSNSPYGDVSYYSSMFNNQGSLDFLRANGVNPVPEPMTLGLLGLGALVAMRRKKKS